MPDTTVSVNVVITTCTLTHNFISIAASKIAKLEGLKTDMPNQIQEENQREVKVKWKRCSLWSCQTGQKS